MKLEIKLTPASKKMLRQLHRDFRQSFIKGLKKAMLFAESKAKKSFGDEGKPGVKTGYLRRTIRSGVKVTSDNAIGFLSANTVYAAIHEFGGIIRPRHADYLKFQIGGQWRKVRQVTMPDRPYLRPAIEDNINKIEDIIKDTIINQVNK